MIDWICLVENLLPITPVVFLFLILIVALIFQVRKGRSYFEAYLRTCERAQYLAKKIDQLYEENNHLDVYTCFKCDFLDCPERWDHYNTIGDCLHDK